MNVTLQEEKSKEFKKEEKKVLNCSYLTRRFVRSRVLQVQVLRLVTLCSNTPVSWQNGVCVVPTCTKCFSAFCMFNVTKPLYFTLKNSAAARNRLPIGRSRNTSKRLLPVSVPFIAVCKAPTQYHFTFSNNEHLKRTLFSKR